jgi:hypothetical protein
MGLDIRMPLGLIFLALGGIMTVYGVATRGSSMYALAMGVNLNLVWGAVMVLFGLVMVIAAKRAR